MHLVFSLLAVLFMYANVYTRNLIHDRKRAKWMLLQQISIKVLNVGVFFPLSIVGNAKEQKLKRRANFFLALFWICFAVVFIFLIAESY